MHVYTCHMDTDLLVVGVARVRHLAPQREHSVPGVSNTRAYAYMQIYIHSYGYMYICMCIHAQAAGTLRYQFRHYRLTGCSGSDKYVTSMQHVSRPRQICDICLRCDIPRHGQICDICLGCDISRQRQVCGLCPSISTTARPDTAACLSLPLSHMCR